MSLTADTRAIGVVEVGITGRDGFVGSWVTLNMTQRGREPVWPVVDVLTSRDVPVVLSSGDVVAIPSTCTYLPGCLKPIQDRELVQVFAHAPSSSSVVSS